jgi:hypothetical protein
MVPAAAAAIENTPTGVNLTAILLMWINAAVITSRARITSSLPFTEINPIPTAIQKTTMAGTVPAERELKGFVGM